MKKADIEFERVLFGITSLVDKWWYLDGHLQMDVRFLEIQIGTGTDISEVDIPDAILVFKGVGTCKRSVVEILFGGSSARTSEETDNSENPSEEELNGYGFSAQSAEPSGNINWAIRAHSFVLYLREEDLKKIEEAENAVSTDKNRTW